MFLQPQGSVWYRNFLEGHVHLITTVGAERGFRGVGAGLRMNVLEFSKANALDFAGESTAGMRCLETRRGLLSLLLRSFLVYVQLDVNILSLDDGAAGTSYSTSQVALQWGGGVQWGPNIRISGVGRLFIDTGFHFTSMAGAKYVVPVAGLGANF